MAMCKFDTDQYDLNIRNNIDKENKLYRHM